jgi:hypothetical protein
MGVELTVVGIGSTGNVVGVLNPGLSFLFQKLLCRHNAMGEESEMHVFSSHTGISISALMEMDSESEDVTSVDLHRYSEYSVNDEQVVQKATLSNNLSPALVCISAIADYLENTPLPKDAFAHTLSPEMLAYFSGDLKSSNSFVADLGNLHQSLIRLQASGATTVYFVYQ